MVRITFEVVSNIPGQHFPNFIYFSSNIRVKDNPPAKDGLTSDDCERIITSLLLEKVIATNPVWNAYEYVVSVCLYDYDVQDVL
jgi:hypothetical protein